MKRRGFLFLSCVFATLFLAAWVYGQDLPIGFTDEQDGGTYRLKKRNDEARFGYTVGPQSWKPYLFPSSALLMKAQRTSDGFTATAPVDTVRPQAFIGVRACDLNAIAVDTTNDSTDLAIIQPD